MNPMHTPPPSTALRRIAQSNILAGTRRMLEIQSETFERTNEHQSTPKAKSVTKSLEGALKTNVSSTSSKAAKIKQLELQAKIERETINKQLAADIAAVEAESSRHSHQGERQSERSCATSVDNKVKQWLERSQLDAQENPPVDMPPHAEAPGTSSEIQLLACALKDALLTSQTHNQHFMSRLSNDKELPSFYGDPIDWLHFKEIYTESSKLCQFSDAENIWRLRKCLKGEARETVSSLLTGKTTATEIMFTLQLRYGRPEEIISKLTSKLRKLNPLPESYHNHIVNFAIKIKNYVSAAQSIDQHDFLRSPEMFTSIVSKCPASLITKWSDYYFQMCKQAHNISKLEMFSQFLMEEASKTSAAGVTNILHQTDYKKKPDERRTNQHSVFLQATESEEKKICLYCHGTYHKLVDCMKFKRAMRKDRWRYVKSKHLCHKCLSKHNNREECPAYNCDAPNCGLPHHRLLHWPLPQPSAQPVQKDTVNLCESQLEHEPNIEEVNSSEWGEGTRETVTNIMSATTAAAAAAASIVMLKIVPVTITGPKGACTTYALLDDGASVSLLASEIAETIGLNGKKQSIRMRGAWDNTEIVCESEIVCCNISGKDVNCVPFQFQARKIKELNLPAQNMYKVDCSKYKHLKPIHYYFNIDCKSIVPKILIGQDNYNLIKPIKILSGNKNEPFGTLTPLGWCVHGPTSTTLSAKNRSHTNEQVLFIPIYDSVNHLPTCDKPLQNEYCTSNQSNIYLNELVRKSFALDALGVSATPPRSNRDDIRALDILRNTSRLVNGRWEVGLPWRNAEVVLPESYTNANKRLKSIQRKMSLNPGFSIRYTERINHLLDNQYARQLSDTEIKEGSRLWYLPHFGVDNPNKKKLRLVFDAAATNNGFCLNSYLLQGPNLLNSLLGIMLRFRENKVGISGDIRDMFLRIKIRNEDQHALRFLWRSNLSEKVRHYAMTSLIFGANCSPFVAQFIKNINAERFSDTYPKAVRAIIDNHYMDDYLDSFDDAQSTIKTMSEVTHIHQQGGFDITNWTSNNTQVCTHIPETTLSPASVKLNFNSDDYERTLGLLWYPSSDTLGFNLCYRNIPLKIMNGTQVPTKRELLRIIMSIYDIYGLLAPFTIKAKILFQSAWKQNLDWDSKITDDMFVCFTEWLSQLKDIMNIRVPRWYFDAPLSDLTVELHVFCDASPSAYAAVAYWRYYKHSNVQNVNVTFVLSKSRVAPVKGVTIPRLELQGAVLGSRLAHTIREEHRIQVARTVYWTDSTTVLQWIRNDQKTYNAFLANRLGEIDSLSSVKEWRYVPSELNIADLASKCRDYNLDNNCDWYRGPKFLYLAPEEWPKDFTGNQKIEEVVVHTIDIKYFNLPVPDPIRFSTWLRLLRTMATVLLFIKRCDKTKTKEEKKQILIDTYLLEQARVMLLRYSQMQSFSKEIKLLIDNKELARDSRLRNLTPFLDENNLLRVQGRIDAVQGIVSGTKRPVILDGDNYIARLIVKEYHVRAAHASNEMVINELRQRYWLLKLRPTVRSISSQCLACRIRKAKPVPPRMGDLPEGRLSHHQRPFTHCGLDLFGPIEITVGRKRDKRYGVLFTCMTVRAIHIELVATLTTDSLIMALRRLASRRGWPARFYSDNGTNLRGAEAELKRCFLELDHSKIKDYANTYGVDWQFISPVSPHMGGAWERLIRSVKTALKVILKERAPREETLMTLLAEVEAMINSRPLGHVSVEPHTDETLTPNHFLLGSSSILPVPGLFDDSDLFLRRQWRIAQRLSDMFWKRWVTEILPCLLPRSKWTEDTQPLQIGDIVFVVDPNSPRNTWLKGRVLEILPGKDGRVRVVDVVTKNGILRRPATRVAALPRSDECRFNTRGELVADTRI